MLYGALTLGARSGPDACATVEARMIDGPTRVVMLAAVQGVLATPSLEGIKSALAKLSHADVAAAAKLAASAPPSPYASGVAVALVAGAHVLVASTGAAQCYLERRGTLEAVGPGAYELASGDAILAASHGGLLPEGRPFFAAVITSAPDEELRNDGLDAALETALARATGEFLAIAAARMGS